MFPGFLTLSLAGNCIARKRATLITIALFLQKQAQQHGSMAIPQQPASAKTADSAADVGMDLATSADV